MKEKKIAIYMDKNDPSEWCRKDIQSRGAVWSHQTPEIHHNTVPGNAHLMHNYTIAVYTANEKKK